MANSNSATIRHINEDFPIVDLGHQSWSYGEVLGIGHYWSGDAVPPSRQTAVVMLWSDTSLYVRFSCNQSEPLNINPKPKSEKKTQGLWERDVCELFIRPSAGAPGNYFEFEVSPTGEWLDLEIQHNLGKRETNWEYFSGLNAAAEIRTGSFMTAMKIPWNSLGKTPETGDCWRGNLFRIVGGGESRGYLAWQPTETKVPNFHVPEKFGRFCFASAAPDHA